MCDCGDQKSDLGLSLCSHCKKEEQYSRFSISVPMNLPFYHNSLQEYYY